MELKKVIINGFKSVKEQVTILVDPRVSIFIGANDHGKSNLLEAILRLNDDRPITEEDIHWDLPPESTPRIEWHFQFKEDDIIQKIKEIAEREDEPIVEPESSESGEVSDEVEAAPAEEELEEPIPEETTPVNTNKELVLYREGSNSPLKILSAPFAVPLSREEEVIALRPRVELFFPPDIELKDETTLSQLNGGKDFEFMQGIFRLAGIWDIKDTVFIANDQNSRALDEASARLTDVLNSTWNQGRDLIWHLKHQGTNKITIKIQDPAVSGRYTRPSLKSTGFRTYFLLSMITFARAKSHPSNSYIYLFDEPGTSLHPRAQIDLQRSLEALSDDTQIAYTTHSMFLINKNYPDRNMVVVKTKDGTKLNLKPFQKNWKAVRESLGILLSNNFLIAEKTVLVEGPSDVIYLLNAIKGMKEAGQIDTDLNDLSIVDAGDETNFVALAKLMLEEGRSVLAIMDGDNSGNNIKARLEKVCKPEIATKSLQILQLGNEDSTEDILTETALLKKATLNVVDNLVNDGIRTLKSGIDPNTEIAKIKKTPGKTLGLLLDETTKSWFEPEEKISKLSVALNYEDQQDSKKISEAAQKLVNDINGRLNLRAEKAYETGVFEEINE